MDKYQKNKLFRDKNKENGENKLQKLGESLKSIAHKAYEANLARCNAAAVANRYRHVVNDDFWIHANSVLDDYRYKRFDYYYEQNIWAKPPYLTVTFPTQHTPDDATCEEALRNFAMVLKRYCEAYGWDIRWFPTYRKDGNNVTLTIAYCEYADEMPYLKAWRAKEIKLVSAPNVGALEEYMGVTPKKITDIMLGFRNEEWQKYGVKKPIFWSLNEANSAAIVGVSGSGKTVEAQRVVLQLLQAGFKVWIADYKVGGDWDGIVENYAEGDGCDAVIDGFCNEFRAARERGTAPEQRQVLVIDEFSSLALSKSSAEFKALMAKLSQVAFMGRSFGFSLLIISQSLPSTVMDTAIRDQLAVKVHLGRQITSTAAQMLFPNSDIDKAERLPEHCGYVSTPSCSLAVLRLPNVKNVTELKAQLQRIGQAQIKRDRLPQ